MTLKGIELNGFKSFGKKSALLFTTPITSVVGPNGSGKSNIVEAIRFVLGEQSMKSLRGKGGTDLIFKGSKDLSSLSRASVTMTFDNSKKIFSFTNSELGVSLEYDEITIGREVFADGAHRYTINGTEVRLKDVVDLLASVNIGSSGHHIISQGEADRVLNASSKDRRAMIEDALGLKVYQYRIRESERKLEKTLSNIKEVHVLRREVAPHLAFLKKQVTLIEKAREMREELRGLYKTYLSAESTFITQEAERLLRVRAELDAEVRSYDEKLASIDSIPSLKNRESKTQEDIRVCDEMLSSIRMKKDEQSRIIGRLEGMIERLSSDIARASVKKENHIPFSVWDDTLCYLDSQIRQALEDSDPSSVRQSLIDMQSRIVSIRTSHDSSTIPLDESITLEYERIKKERDDALDVIESLSKKEHDIRVEIDALRKTEVASYSEERERERTRYEVLEKRNSASSRLHTLTFEEEKCTLLKNALEMELVEAGTLIGREVVDFARTPHEGEINRTSQEDIHRKIERIKIKLEDSGVGNSSEILKEYEDTEERDRFLAREIEDLNMSITSLRDIIRELKETLDQEFKTGVLKINTQFQEFFSLMFGGGSAFLSIVMEHKKPKNTDDVELESESESDDEPASLGFERGIEIHVSLPQKKVKDLHMLSGGERSLTSIALLFAMSQVNPPPFLVLDETDAALDEANSRKYGNMLENLSRYSQLIVVTHNRETMSRAQVLYGITMGKEGASKLLSIHLEDAALYAK